ncbi:MAG TPA: M1 family metallopeptidase [Pseudomonadales bacterium]|nr:M1 family metallopeptidase [Pseudomonadales bacterium]
MTRKTLLASIASAFLFGSLVTACSSSDKVTVSSSPAASLAARDHRIDHHSFSNPDEMVVRHVSLDLTVDFEASILEGSASLTVERMATDANTLILDTRDLDIAASYCGDTSIPFQVGEKDQHLGSPLSIELPADCSVVRVSYRTTPGASGLQWLTPQQTAGKKHPFLFSQAQAIHARSFIPLQDSPGVRITYDATIRTSPELMAVMSAANDPNAERDGVYEFDMPQPIPSYLIAIAVGDIHFKPMGERTGIYSEPAYLEAAAAEFEDTEAMLIATEKVYGKYRWDRYDLLILPPSFPFGGMENPRLSFITPTVLAGDKSLVSLIAHELAHSWSGNTVTNATWRDLWMNEGFTTYLTYRIMEIVYGTDREAMEFVLGYGDLTADIEDLPADDTLLAIDMKGRDPDAVFSNIPYEKGALFLRELEQRIGREAFDAFLLKYFEHFAFQSITTAQFEDYLNTELLSAHPSAISQARLTQWIHGPGIPEGAPLPNSPAFEVVDAARQAWLSGEMAAADIPSGAWVFHQWMHFLQGMPAELTLQQMQELDDAFAFTASNNNEIAHVWLLLSIQHWYENAFDRLHNYLTTIGRNKLVKPLYRELAKTPEGRAFGAKAFAQAKEGYHPLTVKTNLPFVTEKDDDQ